MKRITIIITLLLAMTYTAAAADCPDCPDTSNSACKPWSNGKASFKWVSAPGTPSSGITLTAGPCGQSGESAKAYVFSSANAHQKSCDQDSETNPCDSQSQYGQGLAIVKVTGSQKAYNNIFPSGIFFHRR